MQTTYSISIKNDFEHILSGKYNAIKFVWIQDFILDKIHEMKAEIQYI